MKNWVTSVAIGLLVVAFEAWEGGTLPVQLDLAAEAVKKIEQTPGAMELDFSVKEDAEAVDLGDIWSNCG